MSQTSRGQHMLKVVIENLRFLSLCAICWCCSVSVVSDSLRPHGLQHARSPHPLPSLRACSNSCPLSRWCHPTTSSSVVPFSRLQSFPASGSFPMSQFFTSGGQSTGVSASASVLLMNIQDWFPLGLTLISFVTSSEPNALLMLQTVSDALWPILNLNKKITQGASLWLSW